MLFFGIIVLVTIILCVIGSVSSKKNEQQQHQNVQQQHQNVLLDMAEGLDYVKVLGTRTGTETIGETNYNSTLILLLLVYKDGRKTTVEVKNEEIHYFDKFIQA